MSYSKSLYYTNNGTGDTGPEGPPGPQGPIGDQGIQGLPGDSGFLANYSNWSERPGKAVFSCQSLPSISGNSFLSIVSNSGFRGFKILTTGTYKFIMGFTHIPSNGNLDARFNGVIRLSNTPNNTGTGTSAPKPIPFQNIKSITCKGNCRGNRNSTDSNKYLDSNDDTSYWANKTEAQLVFSGANSSYDSNGNNTAGAWGLGYEVIYNNGIPQTNYFTMTFEAEIDANTELFLQHATDMSSGSNKPTIRSFATVQKIGNAP